MGKPTNFSLYGYVWISNCWLLFCFRVWAPYPFHHIWDGINNGHVLHTAIMKDGEVILAGFSAVEINGDSTCSYVGLLELQNP